MGNCAGYCNGCRDDGQSGYNQVARGSYRDKENYN